MYFVICVRFNLKYNKYAEHISNISVVDGWHQHHRTTYQRVQTEHQV